MPKVGYLGGIFFFPNKISKSRVFRHLRAKKCWSQHFFRLHITREPLHLWTRNFHTSYKSIRRRDSRKEFSLGFLVFEIFKFEVFFWKTVKFAKKTARKSDCKIWKNIFFLNSCLESLHNHLKNICSKFGWVWIRFAPVRCNWNCKMPK